MAVGEGARTSLARFSLTCSDAEGLAAFYQSVLGCRRLASERRSGAAFESLMGVQSGALCIALQLGAQIVELLQFDRPGRAYPSEATTDDLLFQHFAIVVRDMTQAYARLSAAAGWTAISRGGPQRLPRSSGGVIAFKFRDPEGHPLELLSFADDAVPPAWQKPGEAVFLGIDHSAISIADTTRSIGFYRALGFTVAARTFNRGAEQEALDGLAGVEVEVTALRTDPAPPHLELLCYRTTPYLTGATHPNDIAATRLALCVPDCAPHGLIDPDGHRLLLVP